MWCGCCWVATYDEFTLNLFLGLLSNSKLWPVSPVCRHRFCRPSEVLRPTSFHFCSSQMAFSRFTTPSNDIECDRRGWRSLPDRFISFFPNIFFFCPTDFINGSKSSIYSLRRRFSSVHLHWMAVGWRIESVVSHYYSIWVSIVVVVIVPLVCTFKVIVCVCVCSSLMRFTRPLKLLSTKLYNSIRNEIIRFWRRKIIPTFNYICCDCSWFAMFFSSLFAAAVLVVVTHFIELKIKVMKKRSARRRRRTNWEKKTMMMMVAAEAAKKEEEEE